MRPSLVLKFSLLLMTLSLVALALLTWERDRAGTTTETTGTTSQRPVVAEKQTQVRIESPPAWFWITLVALGALLVVAIVTYLVYNLRANLEAERREAKKADDERKAFESAVDRLREKMELPSLLELNRLMLDSYHQIATTQAERSFRSSQNAMRSGFAWLLGCFAIGFVFPGHSATIVIGSLGVTGGALAGFLGRTYLRVHERALLQLNQYFNQPLLNSYYLTAERLIKEMSPTAKDDLLGDVISSLLDETRALSASPNRETAKQSRSNRRRNGRKTADPALGNGHVPTSESAASSR